VSTITPLAAEMASQHADGATAVDLRGVGVVFETDRGGVTALDDVSLTVAEGGFLSMLGPSGCGKSTLLRCVADLQSLSQGSISVFGRDPVAARRDREISFVFQDATLLPWRSAIDNVNLPLEVGNGSTRDHTAPESLLNLVGLADRHDALPHELSGGMRQRVAIARALVCRPRILLMDEPFGAVDEITRDGLNEALLRLWRETGTSILFVTHSIPEAAFLGQQVAVMSANPGRIQKIVDINLPYPRQLGVRDTPEFIKITAHLRQLLGNS
jgi:NitT/TauT family transport system ATP-binding protein